MAPPTTRGAANWAVRQVIALVEIWALVAQHSGFAGAWRLTGVCKASRAGVKEWLGTLPGMVVYGWTWSAWNAVVRLDLATLRWKCMPSLVRTASGCASCSVRGSLVVLGGNCGTEQYDLTSRVEVLSQVDGTFIDFPPLSCGTIDGAVAIAVEEGDSAAGQILLLGGVVDDVKDGIYRNGPTSTVYLVDLATGVCTVQKSTLLSSRANFASARMADGRIVCAGGYGEHVGDDSSSSAEVWGPLEQGAKDAVWTSMQLPTMSVGRHQCCGGVMSDGRFAVLGGTNLDFTPVSSCEALVFGGDAHWEALPPMHITRADFTCAAVAGCIIVAGGYQSGGEGQSKSVELYDEASNRWIQLPCDLPNDDSL
jgi:hypothetical protein